MLEATFVKVAFYICISKKELQFIKIRKRKRKTQKGWWIFGLVLNEFRKFAIA